ncbi:MAG: adenylate/guanylate cyclase domain-containing protein [Leptospiraceae bacterium]|nr:adenylate/guanylate cyclase domain-containing protein [Leptospiraceae bacterium]
MLQLIWNLLAYTGVSYEKNLGEQKHIVLVNSISLFLTVFNLLNVLVGSLLGTNTREISSIFIGYAFLVLFTLFLNSKGKPDWARYYLIYLSVLLITSLTVIYGNLIRIHMFYLTIIYMIFFAFPARKRFLVHLNIFVITSVYSLFEIFHESLPPYLHPNPSILEVQKIVYNLSFAMILLGFSYYVYSSFRTSEITVQLEHDKSEKLLQNILPDKIIKKLRENPDTIADSFDNCTVLFSDLVGFTQLSQTMTAGTLVSLLNDVFSKFDDLVEKYGLEKIKTIGDAYMVAGGLPTPDSRHAHKIADFALDIMKVVKDFNTGSDSPLQIRIGIHSGSAVAGVIGKKKFIYDLWGSSVNTASRMESHGKPGEIHVSESTYEILKDEFEFSDNIEVELKGIGKVQGYFLKERKNTILN